MKKHYQVTLTTVQPVTEGEDFYLYRCFESKAEAMKAAKLLSTFIPYNEYPTTVEIEEYDMESNILKNGRVIKRYYLRDEEGQIV